MSRKTPNNRSARTDTISVSVTPEVKRQLLDRVARREKDHTSWSVNREAFELILWALSVDEKSAWFLQWRAAYAR